MQIKKEQNNIYERLTSSTKISNQYNSVFGTLSNIYDIAFWGKKLMTKGNTECSFSWATAAFNLAAI